MDPRLRRALAVVGAAAALVAAAAIGRATAPAAAPAARPHPSASPSPVTLLRVGGLPIANVQVELTDELEPHDYTGTAPPEIATPVDGLYLRIVKLDALGGPSIGLPVRCFRCIPFRISPGLETLTLYHGRFYLEHQTSGFRALGHFRVDGDRIAFFNDPNCSSTEGTYRWSEGKETLRFRVIEDPCPFKDERADDFGYSPWIRVDACTFRIMDWWPALLGCSR